MSDVMTPIPFGNLMEWVLAERKTGAVFGVRKAFVPVPGKLLDLFGERLETPFGPAAGPNTQLTQNIVAAYYGGARFFELKTVQIMDGEELSKCISKPCIVAEDECYNCEWSTELTVPQAMDENIKAWWMLKLLTKEFGWGDPEGFVFNMSVGYDFAGITSPKIDAFLEGMMHADQTAIWMECKAWARANLSRFTHIDEAYLDGIEPRVCRQATLSTLHGCPPAEIEKIASYLIEVKKLHTFVKCNPTILGYATARKTLDDLGFDYVSFDEHHFNEDLQYGDAVPMFRRLLALAKRNGVSFGLKLSNTFPVDVTRGELPSNEMYMSGRALYPLTIEMARRISDEFDGKLRLSFSGGIDAFNMDALFDAGIWPITLATTILKPGGYGRLEQLGNQAVRHDYAPYSGVDVGKVDQLAHQARASVRNRKAIKPLPKRKLDEKVPLFDCFTAPCTHGCPIGQDIPQYIELVGQGKYAEALRVITEKNPLPFITGTICPHHCAEKCTRNFYDEAVRIRRTKLSAAQNGFDALLKTMAPPAVKKGLKVAVVGGGPAGMAAAYFLARKGAAVTLFEKRGQLGGIVRYVIPSFRIPDASIDNDVRLLERFGVEIRKNTLAPDADALFAAGYTQIIYAIGAWAEGRMPLKEGEAQNVIAFLEKAKNGTLGSIGENVIVIGGGNTAMDAARVAKRTKGVRRAMLVYRRTARYMPADEEELQLAKDEGVEFMELLSPVAYRNGTLLCEKMRLGAPDASGRRSPVPTGETVTLPCDTLIAAVGEKVETDLLTANGVKLDAKGKVTADANLQTSRERVYVIGDCRRGPATVVEGIADAARAAEAIVGKYEYEIGKDAFVSKQSCYEKQGILRDYRNAESEHERCLNCRTVCECCVQVCPNRANVAVDVPGFTHPQILHVDRMCNECGNCLVFCPYDSRPYREKWTLFATEPEFDGSENDGFLPMADGCKVRLFGKVKRVTDLSELPDGVKAFIETVVKDYSYLIG
ncbi:MAG: putative selenate reductase subunit YgfK [Clostridia bacterium]|nr:putative selenate reductase subunit YgfK [Clostridia bacterium]